MCCTAWRHHASGCSIGDTCVCVLCVWGGIDVQHMRGGVLVHGRIIYMSVRAHTIPMFPSQNPVPHNNTPTYLWAGCTKCMHTLMLGTCIHHRHGQSHGFQVKHHGQRPPLCFHMQSAFPTLHNPIRGQRHAPTFDHRCPGWLCWGGTQCAHTCIQCAHTGIQYTSVQYTTSLSVCCWYCCCTCCCIQHTNSCCTVGWHAAATAPTHMHPLYVEGCCAAVDHTCKLLHTTNQRSTCVCDVGCVCVLLGCCWGGVGVVLTYTATHPPHSTTHPHTHTHTPHTPHTPGSPSSTTGGALTVTCTSCTSISTRHSTRSTRVRCVRMVCRIRAPVAKPPGCPSTGAVCMWLCVCGCVLMWLCVCGCDTRTW